MIRNDKIIASLFGGVGFRNSTLPMPTISPKNQESRSGLYFQDANFVTLQNIYDCQENKDITEDQFNLLLENMQKTAILDGVRKVTKGESNFIANVNLYPFEKTFDNVITKNGKLVLIEIEPLRSEIVSKIKWVELSFDADATFNLYLFNSNLEDPIETKEVTTSAGEAKVVNLDWYISNDDSYKGGTFYIGYYEDDVNANACKKDYDLASLRVETPYFNVEPVYMDGWNVRKKTYSSKSYGLNLGIEIYTDYTQLIIQNQELFWDVIQLQMTEKVLNLIQSSTRTNIKERALAARLELHGSKEHGITGIKEQLDIAVSTLRKALFYVPRVRRTTLRT
jgi:hypothetical protein